MYKLILNGVYKLNRFPQILKIDSDNIIHKLTTNDIDCYYQLQNLLTNLKPLNKTIYILSNILPTEGILSLVKRTNDNKNIR